MAFTQGDDLNILQQTDASVVSAAAGNDTYVLAPGSLGVGQKISINDTQGTNTLKLAGGLEIVSSKVASNTLQLTLSNEAVVTLNGAAGYRFDVGGTALAGGVAKNFAGFAKDVLGVTVPTSGLVEGGAISVNDTLPVNPDVDLPARVIYETEPNDQLSHADSAAFGDTLKGTSHEDGDRDVFKLEATEGGKVTLDFIHPNGQGSEGAEISLALADAAGNIISERTFNGNDTLNATVPIAGRYHVIVKDETGSYSSGVNGKVEQGLYAIKTHFERADATAFDAAQNDTFSRAVATLGDGETPLTFGHHAVGSVAKNGDVDVYRINADQGGAVTIDVRHPKGPGNEGYEMQIELLNLQGQCVAERDFRGDMTLNASVVEAGDYYVRISDSDGAYDNGVEDGTYHLTTRIDTQAGRAYDAANNSQLNTAVTTLADGTTPLAFGHAVQGSVGGEGDRDVYRFSADQGGAVIIDVSHPSGAGQDGHEMKIELLDFDGKQVAWREFNGDMTLNASVAEAGDYYVRITDSNGAYTGGIEDDFYHFNTRLETKAGRAYDTADNATLANAVDTLADGTTVLDFTHSLQGSVGASSDDDVFRFTADSTGRVTTQFTHPNGPGSEGAAMELEILDARGVIVISNNNLRGSDSALSFDVTRGEDYYVRIADEHGAYSHSATGVDVEDNFYYVDFLIA